MHILLDIYTFLEFEFCCLELMAVRRIRAPYDSTFNPLCQLVTLGYPGLTYIFNF